MLSLGAPDRFEITEGRAFYRPVGTVSLREAVDMIANAILYTRTKAASALLVNVCALNGFAPPNIVQRYFLIEKWATAANGRVPLAVVAPPEMIHPKKFGVVVAANRGLIADIFVSEGEARGWLDSRSARDKDAAMAGRLDRLDSHALFLAGGVVTVWITRSQGEACDACGRPIPVEQSQYELVMKNGHEMRLDRTCLQRQMQELDG